MRAAHPHQKFQRVPPPGVLLPEYCHLFFNRAAMGRARFLMLAEKGYLLNEDRGIGE